MVYKRGKKIELRKRKETEKEKKIKTRKEKKKKFKERFENFRLTLAIFLLIGVNMIFIFSFGFRACSTEGTTNSFKPADSKILPIETPEKILKVEVLNGCGVPDVAKKLTDFLRQKNIDVVYFGNYEKMDLSETLLIDRKDYSLSNAKIIGKIIGIENRMFPQISPQRQLDVTIIIGKNYSQLKAFEK
jgi:hypothetical protein